MPEITPLFPEDDVLVSIKQGETGDCYLLASLDCILNNTDSGSRAAVKSMFKTLADGSVELRIKRHSASEFLDLRKARGELEEKYEYRRDDDYDVFTISRSRLEEIDDEKIAVKSNSLAVKIFERVSSYYLMEQKTEPDFLKRRGSIDAHNFGDSSFDKRHDVDEPKFVGNLLAIKSLEFERAKIFEMIKLKSIFPGHPIYVQMDFDAEITSGHAYRIDKFEENPDVHGGYEVTLSNPHDNSKEEKCSLNNIRSRAPLFSVFSSNIQNTGLLNMILEEIRNNPKSKIIDYLSTLHKGIPDIVEIFNNAGLEERKRMLTFIRSTFGDKNSFMEIMDFQLPLIKAKIDEKQIKRGISEPESSEDTDKKNIDNLFILLSAQRDREQEKPNSDNPSSNDSKLKNDHKESNTSQNKPRN